ncbi:MAG: Peptidase [Marmoricola sp.]|nr:Peptidase [Marmoricola sp.]
MAELDRLDREYGLGTMPAASTRRSRRGPGSHGPVLPGLLVTAVLLAAIVALSPAENMRSIRRLVGFDDDRPAAAPHVPQCIGSYEFLHIQRGSDQPVAYDPCRPVEVVVNPEGAPDDYDELVDTGLAHTGAATGLQFKRVGLTDDRDVITGGLARRRPVLIAWATPEEVPELAGEVAGIGGSVADGPPGRMRYVTGRVMLDRDLFASFGAGEAASAQAIVDHELGHVVGLGHIEDPGELMNAHALGRTTYGPGDREGLARLGSVDC